MNDKTNIQVDGRFTHEGISVSVYDRGYLLDETWFTWAEVAGMISDEESAFTLEIDT